LPQKIGVTKMKMYKVVIGLGLSVSMLSSLTMAQEPVKTATVEAAKSTLSGTSTKPKNLEWDLRNR
jgi:hypothetical protein